VSKPVAEIKFHLELEVSYDPFQGRTPKEFAELVHDDLHRVLSDFREEDVLGIFSDVASVRLID
tara:strand:+ start:1672 stop:1863 length:192 start_codon:yes stop_codon:yes gene_type:complete